jgi:ssDNA-binding Zn-finger/Zn-ribbon topoisomerase 1
MIENAFRSWEKIMPTIEETAFKCNNPDCDYVEWASYEEPSAFLPEGICPKCNKGELIDTDEKREVTRALKQFIDV